MRLAQVIIMGIEQLRRHGRIIRPTALHQVGWRFGQRRIGVFSQQLLLDLHHLFGPRRRPLFLAVQFAVGVIVILQIIVGDQAQSLDRAHIPFWLWVSPQLSQEGFEYLRPDIFSIQGEAPVPRKVVQAERLQFSPLWSDSRTQPLLQPFQDAHFGGDGHIAHSHCWHAWGIPGKRLCHQPGRVGEVDQQRSRRCQAAHIFGDLEDDRDGAQRLGHPAHAGRLLADQAVPLAQVLIGLPGGHLPHA